MSEEMAADNAARIARQIEKVFHNFKEAQKAEVGELVLQPVKVMNNIEWFRGMTVIDFLGNLGRYARVSVMLAKDSVKSRLQSEEGISFTEFSYQLLQAYDFFQLWTKEKCTVQIGGSDQWGNITAGIELIRKKAPEQQPPTPTKTPVTEEEKDRVYGLTIPLMTTSTGEKFGKSAGNAIWLDSERLSVFDFYQYFRRTADADVEKQLKSFTFLPLGEISEIMDRHSQNPKAHEPQRRLAFEVTGLVHGYKHASRAQIMSEVLFDTDLNKVTTDEVLDAFENDDRLVELPYDKVVGAPLTEFIRDAKGCATKSE
ncbi:tyrosyl-tRNA synthetase [Phlyctochytrium bullatum]|nr:tyrosyl-tRNA synthetase [Phlyctochytrium bullatum]